MNVSEILVTWLKEHGYDGLCDEDCGCGIDHLAPCGDDFGDCEPAHSRKATTADADRLGIEVGDIVYSTEEPAAREAGKDTK